MPFLENVTRGRGIPRERLAAVAEHYLHFGGVSPINGINRALIAQLEAELTDRGSTCRCTSATATGSPTSRIRLRPCATTAFAAQRCSPRRHGADTPAARNTTRTSRVAVRPPVTARPNWSNFASTSTIRCSCEMFVEAIADAAAPCPRSNAPTPGWCSPRTRFRWRPGPAAVPTFTPARSPTRPGSSRRGGICRLRPGVAVAVRAAAGAVAGTRCRPTTCRPSPTRHQGRHRLPDRLRRRPHRGGLGSGLRAAGTGAASLASHSPGRPPPTPTAGSHGWPST